VQYILLSGAHIGLMLGFPSLSSIIIPVRTNVIFGKAILHGLLRRLDTHNALFVFTINANFVANFP